jgi:hypothetical protein
MNGDHHHSDHRPVIIIIEEMEEMRVPCGPQKFHFEAAWVQEEGCSAIVENAWKTTTDINKSSVAEAVRKVATDLQHWSSNVLGDLEK